MARGLSLAAVGLAVFSVAACGSGSSNVARSAGRASASSTPSASPTSKPVIPGTITGRVTLHRPRFGDLTVLTSEVYRLGTHDCGQGAHLAVVDERGEVQLRRDWEWGCAILRPNRPATDGTGNVFLRYNPGRYDGVIILRAIGRHIETFGTLPRSGWRYEGSGPMGYYAKTVEGRRGVLTVEQFNNDCNPSCAGGTTTREFYVWDGHKYVPQNDYRCRSSPLRVIVRQMSTKETPVGARRAVQHVLRAGSFERSSEAEPLPEFPALLQEWNGRVWVQVAEAETRQQVEAFLAPGPDL